MTKEYHKEELQALFNKCLEVNESRKVEAFFELSPHIKAAYVVICKPNWEKREYTKRMKVYYDEYFNKDIYEEIMKELEDAGI